MWQTLQYGKSVTYLCFTLILLQYTCSWIFMKYTKICLWLMPLNEVEFTWIYLNLPDLQLHDLEHDRDELHEIARKDKSTIHEQNVRLRELQLSERNLKEQVRQYRFSLFAPLKQRDVLWNSVCVCLSLHPSVIIDKRQKGIYCICRGCSCSYIPQLFELI